MEDINSMNLSSLSGFDIQQDSNSTQDQIGLDSNSKKKRPPNAFLLFCIDRRPKAREENPDMRNVQISQILADEWRALSETEKNIYKQRSAQEQQSFKQEFPEYKYERAKNKRLEQKRRNDDDFRPISTVLDVKSLVEMSAEDIRSYILYIQNQAMMCQTPDHISNQNNDCYPNDVDRFTHDVFAPQQ